MRKFLVFISAMLLASTIYAQEIGDDGLHKAPWMRETFKDLNEDLASIGVAHGRDLMARWEGAPLDNAARTISLTSSRAMLAELRDGLGEMAAREDVRVLLLRAEGEDVSKWPSSKMTSRSKSQLKP